MARGCFYIGVWGAIHVGARPCSQSARVGGADQDSSLQEGERGGKGGRGSHRASQRGRRPAVLGGFCGRPPLASARASASGQAFIIALGGCAVEAGGEGGGWVGCGLAVVRAPSSSSSTASTLSACLRAWPPPSGNPLPLYGRTAFSKLTTVHAQILVLILREQLTGAAAVLHSLDSCCSPAAPAPDRRRSTAARAARKPS